MENDFPRKIFHEKWAPEENASSTIVVFTRHPSETYD
jgi:hypothetical protein